MKAKLSSPFASILHWVMTHERFLQWVAIVLVLLLACYLRLYKISEYMTFLGDEGRDALIVKRMVVDGKFTLLGPTASVGGFFLGPIYYYFMAPFLWLWRLDPTGPAVMVALFGVATVYMVYHVAKLIGGFWAGLTAASLYALSPVVIAYSRSSWNPNLVPFFSLVMMYLLMRSAQDARIRILCAIGFVMGIGLQLHYLFVFVFPVVGLWLLGRGSWRAILLAIWWVFLGFLVGYAPFLLFELRHGFPNTQSITQFLLTGKDTGFVWATFFDNIWSVVFRLFGRLLFRLPDEGVLVEKLPWQQMVWYWGTIVTAVVTVGYSIVSIVQKRKRAIAPYILLLLWFLVPLILFGFYKRAIYDYYFGIFFTLPFILVGLVLARLFQNTYVRIVAVALWIFLLYYNWQGRPFVFPPNNQYAQMRRIAEAAVEKAEGKPYNFALVADYNSDHAYRFFFEVWNRAPVTIQPVIHDPERNTVTDQLIVICEHACKPLGHPLWEIAGFGRAEVVGEWDVPFVKIYKLVHYTGSETQP